MTLQELLKTIEGLTPEQQKAIIDGMKANKIYTASEETGSIDIITWITR